MDVDRVPDRGVVPRIRHRVERALYRVFAPIAPNSGGEKRQILRWFSRDLVAAEQRLHPLFQMDLRRQARRRLLSHLVFFTFRARGPEVVLWCPQMKTSPARPPR